jgi:hypothetical protein
LELFTSRDSEDGAILELFSRLLPGPPFQESSHVLNVLFVADLRRIPAIEVVQNEIDPLLLSNLPHT